MPDYEGRHFYARGHRDPVSVSGAPLSIVVAGKVLGGSPDPWVTGPSAVG